MYTIAGGKYNPAFPDIDFTATTTDRFAIQDGRVQVISSTEVEKDTGILNFLTSIFLVVGVVYTVAFGALSGIAPFLAAGVFLAEDVIANVVGPPDFTGVGPFVVKSFFPRAITIPGIPQLTLNYNLFRVGGATITGSGTF